MTIWKTIDPFPNWMLFLLDYKMAISVTIFMKTNEFCSMLVFVYSVPYADNDMTPHLPTKFNPYDRGQDVYTNMYIPVLFGRTLRYKSRLLPNGHTINYLLANSRLSQLLVQHTHMVSQCKCIFIFHKYDGISCCKLI